MSDTHRKHLSRADLAERGGQRTTSAAQAIRLEQSGRRPSKPHKQRRVNERAALRREWT